VQQALADAAIFHGMEPAVVDALTAPLPCTAYPAGRVIFDQDSPGDGAFIIVSGKVKLGCAVSDGRENLLSVLGPSEMFGELSVVDPGPRALNATALTPVVVACIDHATMHGWLAQHPDMAIRLMRVLARRLRRSHRSQADLVGSDAPARLARQLLLLAQRFGVQKNGVVRLTHDLTQEELAQLVGTTRETVNKALSEFSSRGWIQVSGRTIVIADTERLARRAR
jgi:CRP/FNR family transcriptional regulator, cyclic AMP receptor protein